jgi:signal transduction histidine kinase
VIPLEHISATLEETRLLARLVSDLQTLSLAEAGQLPLHGSRCRPPTCSPTWRPASPGRQPSWALNSGGCFREEAELELDADLDRLDQVLSNLVANALRHTSLGRAHHAERPARERRSRRRGHRLGHPPKTCPTSSTASGAATSPARGWGAGTGLLAIARQLQAHCGRIAVESQEGRGHGLH